MDAIKQWHNIIETKDLNQLDELLAEEVIFHSPVVWTPQKGKFLTKMYLMAASEVLNVEFKYVKEIISQNAGVLEFNCKIGDVVVNGVDIITWNEEGKITEFKVMVRPLKAVHAIWDKMQAMLEKMKG